MKRKPLEKEQAKILRAQGVSISEIARQLNVSKASVSGWVKGIELSPEQKRKLLYRDYPHDDSVRRRGLKKWSDFNLDKRKNYQDNGRELIKNNNSFLYIAGCSLFWAEGAKNKNVCRLSNSDVDMMRFFIKFLRDEFHIDNNKFKLIINCYTNNDLSLEEIQNFWLEQLGLSRECLMKCQENVLPISSNGNKKGKLLYGVAHLTVNSTELVQTIYGSIQEYFGFEKPEWLL